MEKQQKEFLIKWAKECKKSNNSEIYCSVTIWEYGTMDEFVEIVARSNKIKVSGFEKEVWLDFFREMNTENVIVKFYSGTDGSLPIRRIDADYRFASQSVINEYSTL